MKKVVYYTIYLFVIALIQLTLIDYISIFNIKPNIFLCFVVSIALLCGTLEGAIIGFFAGLIQDITSGKIIGLYALLGLYLGIVMGAVNKRLYRENIIISIFFTFISTIVYELIVCLSMVISGNQIDMLYALWNIILPESVYNSVIGIPMYIIATRLSSQLEYGLKTLKRY